MGHQIMLESYKVNDVSQEEIEAISNEISEYHSDHRTGLNQRIRFIDRTFDTMKEAEAFIESEDSGWYDQLAVKYKEPKKFTPSKKLEKLKKRYMGEEKAGFALAKEHYFKDRKSKTISCKECESSINTDYMRQQNHCPVCFNDMRPDSFKKRLTHKQETIDHLKEMIQTQTELERQKQLKKGFDEYWLVKIEFHI